MPLGVAGWVAVGSAALGAYSSNNAAKKQAQAVKDANNAQIEANQVDPRITSMLFGSGTKTLKPGVQAQWTDTPGPYGFNSQTLTNPDSDFTTDGGLLGRYAGLLDTPQNLGVKQYGQAADNYLGAFTAHDLEAQRGVGSTLMAGNLAAPTMRAAQIGQVPGMAAARVSAPSQNGLNLTGSFDSLINGQPGANQFLEGAIGKAINQSNNAFGAMQRDSTKNLLENILPSIRSGALLSGSYGGSRQGIAEGKALDAFATEQQRALSQFGQYNTDAAVVARAGAYDADRNRQLAATQGLSGQQYGLASQDAAMQQAANQTNYGGLLSTAQNNAQFQQGANQANLQSQLSTNNQNSANMVAGSGITGGLLSQAGAIAGNQDMYDINKATNVNGLLAPYLSKNGTPTQLSPVYSNTAGNLVGGALGGLGLYNQLKQTGMFGSSGGIQGNSVAQGYYPSLTQGTDYNSLINTALNY